MADDKRLTVIITGANNGIGYYMAQELLRQGFCVAAIDLETDHLIKLRDSFPENLIFSKTDVTKPKEVGEFVKNVLNTWNEIDILVNNACLVLFSSFEEKDVEDIKQEFEVNYFGYLNMISALLPHMKKRSTGIIHNLSSGVGITGFPGLCGYASTKGAIEAMSHTLSYELEKYGISVTCMHPPLTNTKSASPLGIPVQVMENPAIVGKRLARKIMVTKPVITPNWNTSFYLFLARRFPDRIGRFMGKMAQKSKKRP